MRNYIPKPFQKIKRKSKGTRLLGRAVPRQKVKMITETGCEGRDRIHLAQNRDQRKAVDGKVVTHLWVLYKAQNFTSRTTVVFSGRTLFHRGNVTCRLQNNCQKSLHKVFA